MSQICKYCGESYGLPDRPAEHDRAECSEIIRFKEREHYAQAKRREVSPEFLHTMDRYRDALEELEGHVDYTGREIINKALGKPS